MTNKKINNNLQTHEVQNYTNEKNILSAFNESISDSSRVRKILLDNLVSQDKKRIRMNLVYVEYNFDKQTVKIDYFVEDKNYPSIELFFYEFENFLTARASL
jgi:hypothetical protein